MGRVDEEKCRSLQRIQSNNRSEITNVSKAGYLWKRGRTLKRWLKRWYVVKNGTMSYAYSTREAAVHKSMIVLSPVRSVRPLSSTIKRTTPKGNVEVMYGMVVDGNGAASVVLYADSEHERNEWVLLFEKSTDSGRFVTDLYAIDFNHPLGCGAFATVVKGVHKVDNQKYAVKIISRSAFQECAEMLHKEINILHMIGQHKYVVTLKEVLHAPLRVYMVFEFCDGGELVDRVTRSRPMGEAPAARVTHQLCEALLHLHKQGVAHMDVKPENIVYQTRDKESPIKLIDFSLATFFHVPTEPGGTPEFVAPEVVRDPNGVAEHGIGGEVDMWAVGILVYFLLSGRTPFNARSVPRILENVMVCKWSWLGKHWPHVSEEAKDFIRRLLQVDPSMRMTAQQALNHPWVNGSMQLPEEPYLTTVQPNPRPVASQKPASHRVSYRGNLKIPGVEKAPAKAQKAVKFMLPAKKAKQLRFMSDEKAKLQGSVPRPAVAAIKEDLWTEPGSPKTPVCHAVAVSELDLITPHKDIVENHLDFASSGAATPNTSPPMKHGSTQFLAADALEILNSISTTRQNKDFSPRHCDRIGHAELHKFNTRQRIRAALLEAAKSPERLAALTPDRTERKTSAAREQKKTYRFHALPSELRMSLFSQSSPGNHRNSSASARSTDSPTWSIPSSLKIK